MAETTFDRLLQLAVDRHGIVTTLDAREAGLDPAHLRILKHRGRLEHLSRGVYRVQAMPISDLLPYAEASAWGGAIGAISHESALSMRGIGDFNPSRIDLTIPTNRFPRTSTPRSLRLHKENLLEAQIEYWKSIRTVTVQTALRQVMQAGSDPYQVRRAISDAYREGEISKHDAEKLRTSLSRGRVKT